ncbi:rhamnogalacturonyl hydrolase YesR [Chitinophaga dinghuensis]|uniref:Rhamnogalacturonyl hydrolase YesR n=2 Tax=Chitinophaga dinghuensis TaxID=1539050 RepID=A0A327WCD7_9BACT|nr:rhamnogalacturonyl hydrolase YesR [Chitinophaga dinghuensis]
MIVMMKKYVSTLLFVLLTIISGKAQQVKDNPRPVDKIKKIGDKLIRETPFAYQLILPARNPRFNGLTFVDFGSTFGKGKPAVAYAYTQLAVGADTTFTIEIAHNNACKVWCNGNLAYAKNKGEEIAIVRDERSMTMSDSFRVHLKKGNNDLLIKSASNGKEWCVFLQPPSEHDAVLNGPRNYAAIGLKQVKYVDSSVSNLNNWLICGPFAPGIDQSHAPETAFRFGAMYPGLETAVTWTVPKQEVLGDVIGAKAWGTTYQWNYHNGGVAWAMEQLSELTNEQQYNQWAVNFCDFQMEGMPFVDYQVNGLRAYNSANAMVINSRLLDFTLAPSIPLIYRLRKEKEFKNDAVYKAYITKMMNYAKTGQIRSPGYSNYTRTTPEEYTVWVDDMFMGIPFLMQAGLYTQDPKEKKLFFDDAANQLLDFTKHVWDKDARLFMHANYSQRPQVKLPYWSRANGWAIWAMTEVLLSLPQDHPKYKPILSLYRDFCNSLIRYQSKDGYWHNVVTRNDSPVEVSGTAIFTMAMARGVRMGWLDKKKFMPVVVNGWKAIDTEIEEDGTVHKICVGTMCSEDENYYMNRPFYDNDTHGSFAVIFAGIEVQRLLDQQKKERK